MKKNIMKSTAVALGVALLFFGTAAEAGKNAGWLIELTAKDTETGLTSVKNRIGQIEGSVKGLDKRDLKEFGGTYPKIAISNIIEGKKFKTDYHGLDKVDEWEFVVTSRDPARTVTLKWSNMYEIEQVSEDRYKIEELDEPMELKKMRLVDTVSGDEIPAVGADRQLQSYTFEMDGTTRTFRWELLKKSTIDKLSKEDRAIIQSELKADKKAERTAIKEAREVSIPSAGEGKSTEIVD